MHAREVLKYLGVPFWRVALFGKKRCLNKLIQQRSLSPSTTYYIGDEVRDVEAAHAAKINSIAVSWGFNSNAKLQQANPSQLISNFEELERMFCEESPHT